METRSCGDGKASAASTPRQPIATGQTIPEAEKLSHREGKAQGATRRSAGPNFYFSPGVKSPALLMTHERLLGFWEPQFINKQYNDS